MQPLRTVVVALVACVCWGCASGGLVAMEGARGQSYYPSVQVRSANLTAPAEVREGFEGRVLSKLAEAGMREGPSLVIEYYVMFHQPGSRTDRFWYLGMSDTAEGKLDVEVIFRDPDGKKLARIQAQGRIKGGVLGGSFGQAIERAADRVAEYTLTWFHTGDYAPAPAGARETPAPQRGGDPSFDRTSEAKFSTTTNDAGC